MEASRASEAQRFAARERLLECVHCGLCLAACPTYVELGTEMDSPRGRIYLMRELEEGRLGLSDDVVRHLDLCLGCRACEPACPSGVQYGTLIEGARAYIERTYRRPLWQRAWRAGIRGLFPHPARLAALLAPVRRLQQLGLWSPFARAIPFATLLPDLNACPPLPAVSPPIGSERGRVGFLQGCVAQALFGETSAAMVRVLNRNGIGVIVPPAQQCCGALHVHGGDPAAARALARSNIAAFPDDLDAIIVNAAGCGAAMKEYGHLLADDADYADRARAFAGKVRDVTEFLAGLPPVPPRSAVPSRVAYHDACHLAHGQGIRDAPRALLRLIPGVELVALPESDLCCGSAGSYNLTEPVMAARLLERKVMNILTTDATCVAAANPGCVLQIQSGLRTRGSKVRVAHPVELLDEAYARDDR